MLLVKPATGANSANYNCSITVHCYTARCTAAAVCQGAQPAVVHMFTGIT
jgi:hypothetical protein